MESSQLTVGLARHNAELLRVLAVAGSSKGISFAERGPLLVRVAQIELELEDELQAELASCKAQSLARSGDFERRVEVDTTRDLIVRAKVALTGRALAASR